MLPTRLPSIAVLYNVMILTTIFTQPFKEAMWYCQQFLKLYYCHNYGYVWFLER